MKTPRNTRPHGYGGLWLTIILFSLVSPNASASFTDVRDYQWWVLQDNTAGGAIASTSVTVPGTPYSHARTALQSVWEVSATYQSVEPSSGTSTVTFQLVVDGSNVNGCSWSITRSSTEIVALGIVPVLTSSLSSDHHYFVRCLNATAVDPGAHTVAISATGTNPVTTSRTDVMLRQTDSVLDTTLDAVETNILNALANNFTTTNNFILSHDGSVSSKLFLSESNITNLINSKDFECTNCSVNQSLVETLSIVELPGMTDQEVGLLLVMLVLMIMGLWYGWFLLAGVAALGVIESFLGNVVLNTAALFFLILIAFWLETFIARRKDQIGRISS